MSSIKLNLEYSGVKEKELIKYKDIVEKIHKQLHEITDKENEFVGWLELPTKNICGNFLCFSDKIL